MSDYIRAAFEFVCEEAHEPKGAYVALMERVPYYGGPEEGGWWGTDTNVVEYQWYSTEEAAARALASVKSLAEQMSKNARRAYGEQCIREMEQCDRRGMDYDSLPEPDGETEYYVILTTDPPGRKPGFPWIQLAQCSDLVRLPLGFDSRRCLSEIRKGGENEA